MRLISNLKIGTKITLVIGLVVIISYAVLGITSYNSASGVLNDNISTDTLSRAEDTALLVAQTVESYKQNLITIASISSIQSMDWNTQKAELNRHVERLGCMRMGVIDMNGFLRSTNDSTADVTGRDYYIEALNGATVVAEPMMSKVDGIMVLILATPIKNTSDRIVGVLIETFDANMLGQIVTRVKVGETGYAYMINNNGITIAHPDAELVINQGNTIEEAKKDTNLAQLAELERKMVNGEKGFGTYSYNGVNKYLAYSPVPDSNWSLAISIAQDEVFRGVYILRQNIIILIVVFMIITIVACMLICMLLVSRPVEVIVNEARKIADGDLNISVDIKSKDELGMLATAFSTMSDNLNDMMTNIDAASEQLAAGSRQISDSSMALSQGATEQASSIEELTASIEEISSQTKLNTQNANQANKLAETAKSNAAQGNSQMKEMVKAMAEINESSTNISKIIKVIDDIAFQTNMLALNAAVEAARAGQHGKGFAVVAEEVKNLAARSANAAKETTEMIEGSIKKAEGGTVIAKNTAEALDKIVNEIEKVADLVSDISIASNEQDQGISQINQGIMQVSQVVQTNSATSEESAAASEELSSQAELLQDMVKKFKLKKKTKTYDSMDDLNPEVLKMLDNMSQKEKMKINSNVTDDFNADGSVKTKTLSDKEFDKY